MPSMTRRGLLAALGAGVTLSGCLSRPSTDGDLGSVDGKWPMDGQGPGHTRAVERGPTDPEQVWRTEFDDVRRVWSASLFDGQLYVYADAATATTRGRHRLYALDAATGAVEWHVPLRMSPNGTPAASPQRIVVAGNRSLKQSRLVCFHPKGGEQWLYDVDARLTAPPTVYGGVAYVGDYAGRVHALGALDGEIRWSRHIDADDGSREFSEPVAVHDGTLYLGSQAGNTGIVALDAETGEERWRADTGRVTSSTPVVADDLVVVRNYGLVTAFDTSGAKRWSFNVGEDTAYPLAVGDEHVYVPAGERLFAIDRGGEEVWRHEPTEGTVSAPTVAGDSVLFQNGTDGGVTAFAADDGEKRWTIDANDSDPVATSESLFLSGGDRVLAFAER